MKPEKRKSYGGHGSWMMRINEYRPLESALMLELALPLVLWLIGLFLVKFHYLFCI